MASGIKYTSLDRYVESYCQYIIRQAKHRLSKKDVTGTLSSSLGFEIKKDKNKWTLEFSGVKYADFVNKGVQGTKGTRTYIDIEGNSKSFPNLPRFLLLGFFYLWRLIQVIFRR